MANTIMTAKNTFGDGLVLDISPENTGANNLSSALNATLITANGNEMTLQNDMGNARVETAYLPDGYIPIGTCEFGDIIYIVSYNPLVNKAQIGCFPSPERNISSEEISNMIQTLQTSDFQILGEDGNPTGELKTMQVKKTLFDDKKLRPGDKYIIYTTDAGYGDSINDFFKHVTQYGAPSINSEFPRLVKLRVASMDSEGKLTYLDSQTNWYKGQDGKSEDYFIAFLQKSGDIPDIDSYRSLTSSAYSIFQSKNSGNLVLVAELEKIDSFNCSYSVIKTGEIDENGKILDKFDVYLHVSWDTPHVDINPFGIRVTGDAVGLDFENGIFEKSLSRLYVPEGKIEYEEDSGMYTYSGISYDKGKSNYKTNNYQTSLQNEISWSKATTNYIEVNIRDKKSKLIIENNDIYIDDSDQGHIIVPDSYWQHITIDDNPTFNKSTNKKQDLLNMVQSKFEAMSRISLAQTLDGNYQLQEKTNLAQYYPNLTKLSKINEKINASTVNLNGEDVLIKPVNFSADVVNNYFKKDYTIYLTSVVYADGKLPVWNIMVYPCMPYGYLEHLGVPLTIDFSKVGTNSIDLTHWKYYNEGLLSTLTYGFDMNLANNYKVKQVAFEFYDDKGLVAVYKSNEKTSYSGMFTERFGLNGENLNYKLSNIDLNGKLIYHAGNISSEGEVQLGQDGNSELKPSLRPIIPDQEFQPISDNNVTYLNDSGVLYTNKLYGVKIIVEYGVVNELGEMISTETKEFYRWYWTNNMFNDKYFQQNDFDFDSITLGLECNYVLQSENDFKTTQVAYYDGTVGANTENLSKTLGADTTYIKGPMSLKLDVGLSENYNTFIPSTKLQVDCKVGLGYKNIIQSYSDISSEDGTVASNISLLTPTSDNSESSEILSNKGNILRDLLGIDKKSDAAEIWENYKNYKSSFNLDISKGGNTEDNTENTSDKYMFNDNEYNVQYKYEDTLESGSLKTIPLELEGISFDKVMYSGIESISKDYPIVESLWSSDVFKGMLGIKEGKVSSNEQDYNVHYFTDVLAITTATDGHNGILKKFTYNKPDGYDTITEDKYKQITTKNKNYQYNNTELLTAIDKLGFTGPLILLSWCSSNTSMDKEQEILKVSGSIINQYNNTLQSSLPSIQNGEQSGLGNSMGAYFQLALYKPNTYLYLLNDIFKYYDPEGKSKGVKFPQVPGIMGDHLPDSTPPNYGLTDVLVRVLNNIYYKSQQTTSVGLSKFTNLAYANNFKEIWNKHVILNINQSEEESDKKTDYSDRINLLNSKKSNSEYYNISDYVKKINNLINEKMPTFSVLLSQSLQVIDCNIDIPQSKLLKTIYSRKTSEPQAIWYKNGDKKNPLYVYQNINNVLFQENNGELKPLSKDFNYQNGSSKIYCDLSWLEYDPEIFIKVRAYPKGNYYKIGNTYREDISGGYRYYENASKDATITGVWLDIL